MKNNSKIKFQNQIPIQTSLRNDVNLARFNGFKLTLQTVHFIPERKLFHLYTYSCDVIDI